MEQLPPPYFSFLLFFFFFRQPMNREKVEERVDWCELSTRFEYIYISNRVVEGWKKFAPNTLFFESSSCKLWKNFEILLHLSLLTIFTEITEMIAVSKTTDRSERGPHHFDRRIFITLIAPALPFVRNSKVRVFEAIPPRIVRARPEDYSRHVISRLRACTRVLHTRVYWNTSGDRA